MTDWQEHKTLPINLTKLREMLGYRQTEIHGFSQSAVSRLESRGDIKLSTLIAYTDAMGLDIEIRVVSRKKRNWIPQEIVILGDIPQKREA